MSELKWSKAYEPFARDHQIGQGYVYHLIVPKPQQNPEDWTCLTYADKALRDYQLEQFIHAYYRGFGSAWQRQSTLSFDAIERPPQVPT